MSLFPFTKAIKDMKLDVYKCGVHVQCTCYPMFSDGYDGPGKFYLVMPWRSLARCVKLAVKHIEYHHKADEHDRKKAQNRYEKVARTLTKLGYPLDGTEQ